MMAKAVALPADQVLLDLEDAVAPNAKDTARPLVIRALTALDFGARALSVRVNAVDTHWCYRDVIDVVESAGAKLDSIVVPKVEGASDVLFVDRLLSQIETAHGLPVGKIGIEAQIESANGVREVDAIASCSPRMHALVLGRGDLSASLGLAQLTIGKTEGEHGGDVWHYVLMRMVIAARSRGLLAIDGPYAVLNDEAGLDRVSRHAAALGFDGKWVIHPTQIDVVSRAFSPDPVMYARSLGILQAYAAESEQEKKGAFRYQGEMIDEATRKMAEAVARRGEWLGLSTSSS